MADIKRETAKICTINHLLNSEFIRAEGWKPSYFSTEIGDISRANIIGVILSNELTNMIVDDGTGQMTIRSFETNTNFSELKVGDLVLIIGRPRVYNENKYLMPEIIKKIDKKWGEYRRKQIDLIKNQAHKQIIKSTPVKNTNQENTNTLQQIIDTIKEFDKGEGANIEEVITKIKDPQTEKIIQKLIEEGEIFEIRPGKVKVLE